MMKSLRGRQSPAARARVFGVMESLELRLVMSAAFDLTGLTDMRTDPTFAGIDGSGVGVAILDSGIYASHPDLRNNVSAFYNAVTGPVPNSIDASSLTQAWDGVGHGTHVAGTVASSNPSLGVAPAAHIVSVKVIPDPLEPQIGGDPLLRGLQFVKRFADQFNIKAVNMSLGFVGQNGGLNLNSVPDPDDLSRAIDDLEAMGITVVTSSGNSYANDPTPGAGYPAVSSTVSVASTWSDTGLEHDFSAISGGSGNDQYFAFENTGQRDRFSATSQRSSLPNQVAAPGVDILSTWNPSAFEGSGLLYNTISGTSMAAPFVTGLVALIQDAAMTYGGKYLDDVSDVFNVLHDTADVIVDTNVSDNGRYLVGNGVLDPTPLNLPETGLTFRRVNALSAIDQVRRLVTGSGGGDTDRTIPTATATPVLDVTRSILRRGNIGSDGSVHIGPNDVDLYRVTLRSPGDISVALSLPAGGTPFPATLRLFNSGGLQIDRVDGANANTYPTLRTDVNQPLPIGVYYVGISCQNNVNYGISGGPAPAGGLSEGDYSLSVALNNPDEDGIASGALSVDLTLPDTLAFASLISNKLESVLGLDTPQPGIVGQPMAVANGDVDMYQVLAPDSGKLKVRTAGTSLYGGNGADTYVRIFDASLVELASNDDIAPGNTDSAAEADVVAGRTYYVAVTNFANRSFDAVDPYGRVEGSTALQQNYNLYLTFDNGDVDGTAVNARLMTIGAPLNDAVGSDNGAPILGADNGKKDVDFVSYVVPSDGLIDLAVTPGTSGFDAALGLWLFDPVQHKIVKVADSVGPSPHLISRVSAGQTIYASVTGQGNQNFNWFAKGSGSGGETGSYSLTSALRPVTDVRSLADNSIQDNTPGTLTSGQTVFGMVGMDGSLVSPADVDLYAFVPPTTGRFDIKTDTSQEGSADTVLRVFDAAGNPVAANDNASAQTTASMLRVTLTAGQTYYVGVTGAGTSSASYDARNGAGAADGSRGAYAITAQPAGPGPAVSVSDSAPVTESYRSGSAATFTITLDQPSAAPVTIAYTTTNATAAAGSDFTATTGSLLFAPGETSKTVSVPVLADAAIEGDETFTLNISVQEGLNSAIADDSGAAIIHNQAVTTLALSNGVRASYIGAGGKRVFYTLKGPGTGNVVLTEDASGQLASVDVSDTTAASSLTITGVSTVGDVNVNGALKSFTGKSADLAGTVNIAGTLGKLLAHSAGGGHTIMVGGGGTLSATFGSVSNESLASASPIKSLKVGSWTDTDATADTITAPSIASLASQGDFGADVTVDSLGKVTVRGALNGANIRSNGAIASVRAGSSAGSRIFAGVRGDLAALPAATSDFVNAAASIGKMSIGGKAGAFADTLIAAPTIGKVVLGAVTTANGGNVFGVAADSLQGILTGNGLRLANLTDPSSSTADGDFAVRIL